MVATNTKAGCGGRFGFPPVLAFAVVLVSLMLAEPSRLTVLGAAPKPAAGPAPGATSRSGASAPASGPASQPALIKMVGTFNWRGKPGKTTPLQAVFKQVGTDQYLVVYRINWYNKDMDFTGAIKGSLKNGEVVGTGKPPTGERLFDFKGTVKDGVISFDHFEVTGGARTKTGTGTMQPAPAGS